MNLPKVISWKVRMGTQATLMLKHSGGEARSHPPECWGEDLYSGDNRPRGGCWGERHSNRPIQAEGFVLDAGYHVGKSWEGRGGRQDGCCSHLGKRCRGCGPGQWADRKDV